jgi:FKBP-type peptidyl-prolyl cis-trans isomerase
MRNACAARHSRLNLGIAVALLVFLIGGCSGRSDEVVCSREPTEGEEGLLIQDVECGSGDPADRGDIVTVQYTGSIQDEGVFDSSGEPYSFRLGVGEVIGGWDEGIRGMQAGGRRILTIPPDLAYGETGLAPDIPPGATLVYKINLVSRREPRD